MSVKNPNRVYKVSCNLARNRLKVKLLKGFILTHTALSDLSRVYLYYEFTYMTHT